MDWSTILGLSNPMTAPMTGINSVVDYFANQGVPPPPLPQDGSPPPTWQGPTQQQPTPALGASLEPSTPGAGGEAAGLGLQPGQPSVPLPQARPAGAPPATMQAAQALKGLQGAVAPQVPAAQKVSTPSAPRPSGQIQGGGLLQLLAALGLQGGHAPVNDYKLPSTLGAALGQTR